MVEFNLDRICGVSPAANVGVDLPASLRNSLERVVGVDLSAVRVVEGNLRTLTEAPAFAYGHRIYVQKGFFRPDTSWGRLLLAHEAAHVVQQFDRRVKPSNVGALLNDDPSLEAEADLMAHRAVTGAHAIPRNNALRPLAPFRPESPVYQCAVGFEFQTGWQAFIEIPSRLKGGPTVVEELPKETMLYGSRHSTLGWCMETDGRDIEFVIDPPIEESEHGLREIKRIFGTLHMYLTALQREQNKPRITPQTHPLLFSRKDRGLVIVPQGHIAAQPQVTVGVRLSRIHVMLEEMSRLGLQANNSTFEREGLPNNFYSRQYNRDGQAGRNSRPVNGQPPSNRLRGLMSMISQYLNQGAQRGNRQYAKDMAYAMARTDAATMFSELSVAEKTYFQADTNRWVRYALENSGLPVTSGGEPLLNQGVTDGGKTYPAARLPLTREDWLKGMAAAQNPVDRFTAAATANDPAYQDPMGGNRLRAPGLLGNTLDPVGNNRSGVILELRQLQRSVPFEQWPGLATRIMEYLIKLNGPMPASGPPQF